jgi:hypothetical protein
MSEKVYLSSLASILLGSKSSASKTPAKEMRTRDDLTCEKAAAEAAREKRIASFMVGIGFCKLENGMVLLEHSRVSSVVDVHQSLISCVSAEFNLWEN